MFNRLKQTGILFVCTIILGFCSSANSLYGATLHAVLVGDTNDLKLGIAMKANMNKVYGELSKVADLTGLDLNVVMTYGKSTKRNQVIEQIEQLEIEPDDVVIAYFSMHGYRTPSKTTPWPNLFFGEDYTGVEFDYLVTTIKDKNPRLLIALADSCNVVFPNNAVDTFPPIMALGFGDYMSDLEISNYKKLFLETSGVIIASGSVPGTAAWGVNAVGTFMTLALLDSLHDIVLETTNVTWEEIFSQLEIRINNYIKRYPSKVVITQTPQYSIELH